MCPMCGEMMYVDDEYNQFKFKRYLCHCGEIVHEPNEKKNETNKPRRNQ